MTLLTESVSTQSVPGFYLSTSAQALALMDEADAANLKLQYDLYHMRIMGDDLARTSRRICIESATCRSQTYPGGTSPEPEKSNFLPCSI